MLKVYLASGFPWKEDIAQLGLQLQKQGFQVVSTWAVKETGPCTPEEDGADALRDTNQVAEADALIAIMNDSTYAYRGTWVEIGTALALGKAVYLVCQGLGSEYEKEAGRYVYPYYSMSNVFFWHPKIIRVQNLQQAIEGLLKEPQE